MPSERSCVDTDARLREVADDWLLNSDNDDTKALRHYVRQLLQSERTRAEAAEKEIATMRARVEASERLSDRVREDLDRAIGQLNDAREMVAELEAERDEWVKLHNGLEPCDVASNMKRDDEVLVELRARVQELELTRTARGSMLDKVEINLEIIIRCLDGSSLRERALEAARQALEEVLAAKEPERGN